MMGMYGIVIERKDGEREIIQRVSGSPMEMIAHVKNLQAEGCVIHCADFLTEKTHKREIKMLMDAISESLNIAMLI